MDALRWLLSWLFGIRWVALTDIDGETNVRRVRWRGGKPYARRHHFREVWLRDDGKLLNGAYVVGWRPYTPFAPKKWPAYRGGVPTDDARSAVDRRGSQ